MKKLGILMGCLFLAFGASHAQSVKPFEFGVKAGLNVNNLSTRFPDYTNDNYFGLHGGAFARINVKRFIVQPELLYTQVGGNVSIIGGGDYELRQQGLMMPILFGYKILDFSLVNLRLHAGPFFAYQFENEVTVSNAVNNFTDDRLNDFTAGVNLGAGIDIWKITFDLRYQWGLTNNLGNNNFANDPNAGLKNAVWEVSLGFKIF